MGKKSFQTLAINLEAQTLMKQIGRQYILKVSPRQGDMGPPLPPGGGSSISGDPLHTVQGHSGRR